MYDYDDIIEEFGKEFGMEVYDADENLKPEYSLDAFRKYRLGVKPRPSVGASGYHPPEPIEPVGSAEFPWDIGPLSDWEENYKKMLTEQKGYLDRGEPVPEG